MKKNEVDPKLAQIGKDRHWLAEKTGYSYSSLRNLLAPKARPLSFAMSRKIQEAFESHENKSTGQSVIECHPTESELKSWIEADLVKDGEFSDFAISRINKLAQGINSINDLEGKITPIPDHIVDANKIVYRFPGQVAAGVNCDMWDNSRTLEAQSDLSPDNHIIVEICGDSGGKQYKDGERWLVCTDRKGMTAQDGKAAIFQDPNGQYLKKFNRSKKSLESIDPAFNDVSPLDGMELVGYPVERLKELKP